MPESQRSLVLLLVCRYPIVEDKNGDGIIDVNDSYMDNTLPKLYFGFGNTFTWKNFDLDIFMYGQLGVKKWNDAYGNSIDVEVFPEEWMRTMLVSILITFGIPRQTRTDASRVSQSVNQWLYPKIWALIIQEKMPLIYV